MQSTKACSHILFCSSNANSFAGHLVVCKYRTTMFSNNCLSSLVCIKQQKTTCAQPIKHNRPKIYDMVCYSINFISSANSFFYFSSLHCVRVNVPRKLEDQLYFYFLRRKTTYRFCQKKFMILTYKLAKRKTQWMHYACVWVVSFILSRRCIIVKATVMLKNTTRNADIHTSFYYFFSLKGKRFFFSLSC